MEDAPDSIPTPELLHEAAVLLAEAQMFERWFDDVCDAIDELDDEHLNESLGDAIKRISVKSGNPWRLRGRFSVAPVRSALATIEKLQRQPKTKAVSDALRLSRRTRHIADSLDRHMAKARMAEKVLGDTRKVFRPSWEEMRAYRSGKNKLPYRTLLYHYLSSVDVDTLKRNLADERRRQNNAARGKASRTTAIDPDTGKPFKVDFTRGVKTERPERYRGPGGHG